MEERKKVGLKLSCTIFVCCLFDSVGMDYIVQTAIINP